MSQQKTFRTAFNGFNREDVVSYIEYMNAKHLSEIKQLNAEIEFLRSQKPEAPAPAPAPVQNTEDPERVAQLQGRCAELETLLEQAEAQREDARAALAQAQAELAAAVAEKDTALQQKQLAETEAACALQAKALAESERDAAKAQQSTVQCRIEQELEAYRRAERTERMARERAEQVYHQVNGVLSDAAVKVDDAAAQIGDLSDKVLSQLNQLQEAVTGSKQALQDAASTLYTIRPNADEE